MAVRFRNNTKHDELTFDALVCRALGRLWVLIESFENNFNIPQTQTP